MQVTIPWEGDEAGNKPGKTTRLGATRNTLVTPSLATLGMQVLPGKE
jgi:hypothetical protein